MTDLFTTLAQRALLLAPATRPLLPPLFARGADAVGNGPVPGGGLISPTARPIPEIQPGPWPEPGASTPGIGPASRPDSGPPENPVNITNPAVLPLSFETQHGSQHKAGPSPAATRRPGGDLTTAGENRLEPGKEMPKTYPPEAAAVAMTRTMDTEASATSLPAGDRQAALPIRLTGSTVTEVAAWQEVRPIGGISLTPGSTAGAPQQPARPAGPVINSPTNQSIPPGVMAGIPPASESSLSDGAIIRPDARPALPQQARPGADVPGEPAGRRRAAPEPSAAAPGVRVSIGRVEVRAVFTPAAPPLQGVKETPARPSLALSDYLKQRDGGSR